MFVIEVHNTIVMFLLSFSKNHEANAEASEGLTTFPCILESQWLLVYHIE